MSEALQDPSSRGARVGLLGPVVCTVDGTDRPIRGAKPRALLATLALQANRVVPVPTIVEAVWGEDVPDGVEHTVQQHVSTLRKALSCETTPPVLVTQAPGYRLDVVSTDAGDFETLAADGSRALEAGDARSAQALLGAALELWRGGALADACDTDRLRAAATRLDQQRLEVLEASVDARLLLGQPGAVVAELEQLVHEHPLRERPRGLLMLALYRCGRQADALAVYRAARDALVEELGIEPGSELRELEQAILEQRESLDGPTPLARSEVYVTYRAEAHEHPPRLVFRDGQAVVLPTGVAVVGRDAGATVRLVDSQVSRRHAELVTTATGASLRDLASTNGTTVNGVPVEQVDLRDGDVIGFGGVELEFRAG